MAKFARLPTRSVKMKGRKARTWAKGHSSDSNPTLTKYRDIALKSRFIINETVTKKVDKSKKKIRFADEEMALKKSENLLEKLTLEDRNNRSEDDEDCQSSIETAETQFTNFTNCTNPTFNKVHRLWKSGSDLQSEVLTVLAAVTEVIKASNEPESEIAYFGALMNSFSQPDQSVKTLAAISYLLSLVICKVSYGALSACFSTVSHELYTKLIQHVDKPEANALIKYTLECMGVMLKAQPLHVWESSSTGKMFDSLLTFTVDERPRIRKASQRAVAEIVNCSMTGLASPKIHPASKNCSKFCTDTINRYADNEKSICTTLYCIMLLQKCMHNFGESSFKHCCETLLNLAQISKATLNQAVYRCLECVFSNRPSDLALTPDMVKQITLAVYTLEPNKNDQFTYLQWCKLLAEIHQCLVDKDKRAFELMFPKFFDVLIGFLSLVDQHEVIYGTVTLVKQVVHGCLNDSLAEQDQIKKEFCQRIMTVVQQLLSLRYFNVWPHCFDILTSFFAVCSKFNETQPELFDFSPLLKSMAELRESGNFLHVAQLDKCIGSAIRHFGPNYVLQSIPLNIDLKKPGLSIGNLPNSWLLPLLRSHVQEAQLSYFIDTFLPVALELTIRLSQQTLIDSERKILEALQQQIWDLLPAYCSKYHKQSLTKIADIVIGLLYNTPTLRLTLLNSVRTLVLKAESDQAKRLLVDCAPKFLPTLIKLFVSDEEDANVKRLAGFDGKGVRMAVMETLRVYLTITPATYLNPYLKVALKKLEDPTELTDTKHRVMDVLVALVKHLSSADMTELFMLVKNFCDEKQCKDKSLQKKAYRILEEAFKSESSDSARKFFDENCPEIMAVLTSRLVKAPASTKASKLRCLNQLFESHLLDIATAPDMLPQAILCLKENNVKTRRSAAIFFITVSNLLIADKKDALAATKIIWDHLSDYFNSSDPVKTACCLIAARLFIFEFKNEVSSETLSMFVSQVIDLLGNQNRQIVQCCLEFLKTFVSCLPQVTVGQYMDTFIPALYTQTEDCQHHFRFLTRKILAKLMRKIPYELIRKLVPDGVFQKQLNNVRKMLQRYEKGKLLGARTTSNNDVGVDDDALSGVTGLSRPETIAQLLKDTDDEDDDADNDEPTFDLGRNDGRVSRKRLTRQSKNDVVLCEDDDGNDGDDDGDILDFMDAKSASKIYAGSSKKKAMTMNAGKENKKSLKRNRGFKTDEQGRLIIASDLSDDGNEETKFDLINLGGKRKGLVDDSGASKKRKKTCSLTKDDEDSDIDEALHYRPGGKGIHRDVSKDGAEPNSFGAEKFRSRKAKGDASGKGGVQPYAYVPFDFKQLNKRKRARTAGKFKNLVRGAKKGAGKGTKGRGKKLKRL